MTSPVSRTRVIITSIPARVKDTICLETAWWGMLNCSEIGICALQPETARTERGNDNPGTSHAAPLSRPPPHSDHQPLEVRTKQGPKWSLSANKHNSAAHVYQIQTLSLFFEMYESHSHTMRLLCCILSMFSKYNPLFRGASPIIDNSVNPKS